MPPYIYQDVIELIVGVPIWRYPSAFRMLQCGNTVPLPIRFSDVVKSTLLLLIIISFMQVLIPNSYQTDFLSEQNFFNTPSNFSQTCLCFITSILSWDMHIQRNYITSMTPQYYILHPVTIRLYPVNF